MKIDLDEALARVGDNGTMASSPDWFTDMDTNKDGFIETEEFDHGLNDQIILDLQDDDQEEWSTTYFGGNSKAQKSKEFI